MIFFIVKNEKPLDNGGIKEIILKNEIDNSISSNNVILISWNEVFKDLDELKSAIKNAVYSDEVCQGMHSQAVNSYGMDFNSAEISAIIDNHLLYWAHPLIGNIVNSTKLRPHEDTEQRNLNWDKLGKYKGPQTLDKINILFKDMDKLTRSGRDQVKICHNIYELARAFLGEVTSSASKRLEKLLALKLCQSEELYTNQCNILDTFNTNYKEQLKNNIVYGNRFKLEYCEYYFNGINGIKWGIDRKKEPLADTAPTFVAVTELIKLAIDKKYALEPNTKFLTKEHLDVWTKLPHTIRCAILINDLRKCFTLLDNPKKLSMQFIKNNGITYKNCYTLGDSAENQFLPQLGFKGGNLIWSWNRDENHISTQTYRHFLCPLWAGPSGHTGGGLVFWKKMLGDEFFRKHECAITIASGFFTFWRLYYDKRISCNHTLTETFEATWCKEIIGALKVYIMPKKIQLKDLQQDGDAFDFIRYQTTIFKGPSVDPITLFMHLKKVYFDNIQKEKKYNFVKTYKNLKELIDQERINVSNLGYWLPQWSRELSDKEGANVQSFAKTFAEKLSKEFAKFTLLNGADKDIIAKNIIMSYIIKN